MLEVGDAARPGFVGSGFKSPLAAGFREEAAGVDDDIKFVAFGLGREGFVCS